MITYLVLNLLFLIPILILVAVKHRHLSWPIILATQSVLLILTAIFDNLIIISGIVNYNLQLISGWYVFIAPIEDFAYAIAAGLLVPLLWQLFTKNQSTP